jgi:DNA-binding response OmpR family regulator
MNGCILVVEYDRATRELLAGNLKDAGYRIFCAGDVPRRRRWFARSGRI